MIRELIHLRLPSFVPLILFLQSSIFSLALVISEFIWYVIGGSQYNYFYYYYYLFFF